MKPLGRKHTKSLPGRCFYKELGKTKSYINKHQDCAICHPTIKNGAKRERRSWKQRLKSLFSGGQNPSSTV